MAVNEHEGEALMFAIQITLQNQSKIEEAIDTKKDGLFFDTFTDSSHKWYIVTNYINRRGQPIGWRILPSYILRRDYEFDENIIETNWDQIVRKETA